MKYKFFIFLFIILINSVCQVYAAPDYSLSVSPSAVSVKQGVSVGYIIFVKSINGFSGDVHILGIGCSGGCPCDVIWDNGNDVYVPSNGYGTKLMTIKTSADSFIGTCTYNLDALDKSGIVGIRHTYFNLTTVSPNTPVSCTDPDANHPDRLKIKGVCNDPLNGAFYDQCESLNSLYELNCQYNSCVAGPVIKCSDYGFYGGCSNGACRYSGGGGGSGCGFRSCLMMAIGPYILEIDPMPIISSISAVLVIIEIIVVMTIFKKLHKTTKKRK